MTTPSPIEVAEELERWARIAVAESPDMERVEDCLYWQAASLLRRQAEELTESRNLVSQYAREAGEAKGRLEMSEAAGIVEGWRERAEAAEAELEKMKGALDAFLEVAPALPKVHRWLDQADAEDVFDLGLRHRNGKGPTAYLTGWLGMFRPFAYATKDDSWGELEKLICIVMRNYVRMIAAADKARAALTPTRDAER